MIISIVDDNLGYVKVMLCLIKLSELKWLNYKLSDVAVCHIRTGRAKNYAQPVIS